MTVDDLITWLKACLDEDEEAAGAAKDDEFATATGIWREVETPAGRRKVVDEFGYSVVEDDRYVSFSGDVSAQPWHSIPHVARHDPARVLREVEAKRKIIAKVVARKHLSNDRDWHGCQSLTEDPTTMNDVPTGKECTCGRDAEVHEILRLLALPYSDHPG